MPKRTKTTARRGPKLMLDSGAFSAWRKQEPIDLDTYCQFLLDNGDVIDTCVVLDYIDPSDPETAAERSFDNWLRMRERGLNPIPVFHAREHIRWLDRMLDAGATYVGLSASSLIEDGSVDHWYDLVWNHLVNSGGLPIVKAHAFGEGRFASVLRYPWYSVDSTNWTYGAGINGTARIADGRFVSWRNDGVSTRSATHVSRLEDAELRLLERYCADVGLAPDILKADSTMLRGLRFYFQALFYKKFEGETELTTLGKRWFPTGFRAPNPANDVAKPQIINRTKFYLVGTVDDAMWTALAKSEYPQILFSYFYLRSGRTWERLKHFIKDPDAAIREYDSWARFLPIYKQETTAQ